MTVRKPHAPPIESVLGSSASVAAGRIAGDGPAGRFPLTADQLREEPSGNLFGLTQNVGMGWSPAALGGPEYVIVSTAGGRRDADGRPLALGYHTGHWEIGQLVDEAARDVSRAWGDSVRGVLQRSVRRQNAGNDGNVRQSSLSERRRDRDAASHPLVADGVRRDGHRDVRQRSSRDDARAGRMQILPGIVVPGGVTLPADWRRGCGTGSELRRAIRARLISLDYAAEMGCRACGSSGGGCQFLGTAATSQVVAEALGLALPHSALAPSGEPAWLELGERSALALIRLHALDIPLHRILTQRAIENAMLVHAAFGGSTNLLLHIPAIAHAAGLPVPTVEDWHRVNLSTPRLVDALPNGPRGLPTVQVFMAGGVPEVMLHLRRMGLLNVDVLTATGDTLDTTLDWWETSDRRREARARLGLRRAIRRTT